MAQLPAVSMDCSADGLLRCLLRAAHSSHGLQAFRPTAEAAAALQQLRSRATVHGGSEQVEPHTAHEAAAALHSLAERFTRATAQRLGMHSYALHPYCDDLPDWLHPADGSEQARTHSAILLSTATQLGEHLDRGLFNLVLGSPADLASIWLNLPSGVGVGLKGLLPTSDEGGLLGLLIPGYTLHCIDERTPAVPHSVHGALEGRCTVVLQWRLRPDYPLSPGVPLSLALSQFEASVRARQEEQLRQEEQARQAAERSARHCTEPTVPPLERYMIFMKNLVGGTLVIDAHPTWTVGNLKWVMLQREGHPCDKQRIIYAGRQLENHQTLEACKIERDSTLHLMLRMVGD